MDAEKREDYKQKVKKINNDGSTKSLVELHK